MKKLLILFISTLLVVGGLAGCAASAENSEEQEELLTLKIGVMPAVDSAPIFLAEQKGYFEEIGLEADIQVYTNAMNRQSALQTGELDGTITDVIALVQNVNNGFDIKVTMSTDGSFPVLVNPDFQEKETVKVGMMEVSVTNYLADRSLSSTYNLDKIYINEIPARLEMVKAGNLDMAIIPEPMASQGELNGMNKKVYESSDDFSPDVMVFTGKAIEEKEKAIQLFHQAYNRAVEDINGNDEVARDILIEKLDLNPEVKDLMILPKYHKARVPSEDYIQRIIDWNEEVLGQEIEVTYEKMVNESFVE